MAALEGQLGIADRSEGRCRGRFHRALDPAGPGLSAVHRSRHGEGLHGRAPPARRCDRAAGGIGRTTGVTPLPRGKDRSSAAALQRLCWAHGGPAQKP
jgi:hypothetical protein